MFNRLWRIMHIRSQLSSSLARIVLLSELVRWPTGWSSRPLLPFTPFFMFHSSRRPWVLTKLSRSCCHHHLFAGVFLRKSFSIIQSLKDQHLCDKVWSSGLNCLLLCLPGKIWNIFVSNFLAPRSGGIQARKREGMSAFLLLGRRRLSSRARRLQLRQEEA